ncbi:DUF397 domain-containing protein [Actinomadura logoneensis]|uniref:DUF397 domain-containing protein n=1 Tax=Actinomadura logoneensis TaxID=2293572 RepID=A0A372JKM3_9ACTN|nr:DUF397 domain-containing protein [Actinomadura logoneensis]RFU40490.1 DUF397 domain-containing protein [Actinomadura logoneensis]
MINWRKSSHSGGGGSGGQECVEVARISRMVGMRDSQASAVGHLSLDSGSFAALVSALKRDKVTP